jgi:hypothetical protein
MKIKNIPRHTVTHMWKAYVKKLLNEHPEYYTKINRNSQVSSFYVYTTIKDSNKKSIGFCIIDYSQFRTIVSQFLERTRYEIIHGNSVSIPGCGRIAATRIERDFRSKRKMKDWKKTMASGKNAETGKYNKVYYYTNDDYCRIGWFKTSYITNITMYEFIPTQSGMCGPGFKEEFSKAIDADPFLKYRFIFSPLTTYILEEQNQS